MTPDEFYLNTMRPLYESGSHLTAIEQRALTPIREKWEALDVHDTTWHAAVGELREDGMTICVPLTLDRLDAYCVEYERTGKTTPFSMQPKEQSCS